MGSACAAAERAPGRWERQSPLGAGLRCALGVEPCAQDGQCPPPSASPCPCDGNDCPEGINKDFGNCTQRSCPAGERRCKLGRACIPHTWLCDGHPDCPDSSDELGCGENATSVVTPGTLESVTYLRNATATSTGDQDSSQSGNRSAYGVIAAAVVLSAGVAAAALLALSRLWAPRCLHPLGLLLAVKESLLPLERKASLL
ncbi:PREDICTED: CD320 antigen [Condylura cristata]|uniref:CD320 antigen n=1 Tax=Condylura cristata TaxID=143302 RepID=UPI0006438CE2|nr:PREDICTED: CD320 antigen [Condylura cristata]